MKIYDLIITCSDRAGLILKRRRDYSQASWENYFDSFEDVNVGESNIFRVYKSGSNGPVLLLLHGGGFSALTWSLFTVSTTVRSHKMTFTTI